MSHPVIVDLFESIATELTAAMGEDVHFRHGHMVEVADIVRQQMIDPDVSKRYPMLILKHDITQKYIPLRGIEFDCTLYLVTLSRPEYVAGQRLETIFKPLLYPLRDELVNQIARSGYFEQQTIAEVEGVTEWIDRLYWGRAQVMGNDANIFGDWVDAIELNINGLVALDDRCGTDSRLPQIVAAITDTSGLWTYIVWDCDMENPIDHHEDVILIYTSGTDMCDALTLLSDKVFLIDHRGSPIGSENVLELQINSGNIKSARGVNFPGVSRYPVVNNSEL